MVNEKKVADRIVEIKQQAFDSKELYKVLKTKIEDLGYIFLEKGHEIKDSKYGGEVKFEFKGMKKWDLFCKSEVVVKVELENMQKIKEEGKTIDLCDGKIIISGTIFTDYRNEWNASEIKKILYDIYIKYFMLLRIKKLYIIPTLKDVDAILSEAKKKIELYD